MEEKTKTIHEWNQIEKCFIRPLKGPLVLSVLTLITGVLYLLLGGLFLFADSNEDLWYGISILILGVSHIPFGIWGISFSKKQNIEILPGTIVVYDGRVGNRRALLGYGWVLWLCTFILSTIAMFISTVSIAGMVVTVFVILFFFCSFALFSLLRKRVELYENTISYVNSVGKVVTYHKSEVKYVLQNAPDGRYYTYEVLGVNDRRLFVINNKMVNASAFVREFEGRIQDYDKVSNKQRNMSYGEGKSFQTEHVKEIRIASWILLAVDVAVGIVLILVYGSTDWLEARQYYLFMGLIPFTFFVFAWIFRDVIIWDDEGKELLKKKGWLKNHYVNISVQTLLMMFFHAFLVTCPLLRTLHCIKGLSMMFVVGFAVFVLLFGVSTARVGLKRLKLGWQWLGILIFSVGISIGTTQLIFYETSSTPTHYTAEVIETSEHHSYRSGTRYYVRTILQDGTEENIWVSKAVYDEIQEGNEAVVCNRTGILGTEFVTVHMP